MVTEERHDRQMRIRGWNQKALEEGVVGFVGDGSLAGVFSASSSALGINNVRVINPTYSSKVNFPEIAREINEECRHRSLDTLCVNRGQYDLFDGASVLVDANGFAIGKKLSLEWMFNSGRPGVLVNARGGKFSMFAYEKGRENKLLQQVMPRNSIPSKKSVDPLTTLIGSGILLEKVKNALMGQGTSPSVVRYDSEKQFVGSPASYRDKKVLVVGAGALGNFVALSLGILGVSDVDILDPDLIEETNLNRQILFYNAIGREKATTLAERISPWVRSPRGIVGEFDSDTDVSSYDTVFDCVDDFTARKSISDVCEQARIPLISGGTSYYAGQAVSSFPGETPSVSEMLNLEHLIAKKKKEEESQEGCIHQPDPSVIMSNQVVGGVMVDLFRKLGSSDFRSQRGGSIVRYDANDPEMIGRLQHG